MKRATESTETTAGTAPVVRFDAVAADDHLIDVLAVSALNDDPLVDDGVGGGLVRLLMEMRRQRKRCGPGFVPGRPEEVAATLLRVDASRHLLKPGGFTVGIRPGPAAPTRSIDDTTMRDLAANLQEATSRRMSASAGLDLLRSGATNTGQRPLDAEVGQALRAGSAIVRERRARAAAEQARARATELRHQRLASSSTALFAARAATGLSLTVVGLASGARAQLTTTVGGDHARWGAPRGPRSHHRVTPGSQPVGAAHGGRGARGRFRLGEPVPAAVRAGQPARQ